MILLKSKVVLWFQKNDSAAESNDVRAVENYILDVIMVSYNWLLDLREVWSFLEIILKQMFSRCFQAD